MTIQHENETERNGKTFGRRNSKCSCNGGKKRHEKGNVELLSFYEMVNEIFIYSVDSVLNIASSHHSSELFHHFRLEVSLDV